MLSQLSIQNFALIKNLTLDFCSGLNALTGETGAGKSILIDGLRFILGERVERIRMGTSQEKVRVEAVFVLPKTFVKNHATGVLVEPFLSDDEDILILRREVEGGKTKCWINNRMVTLTTLKEIGASLVDIHGQYDHQLLLDANSHLELLDRFAKVESLKKSYAEVYGAYHSWVSKEKALLAKQEGKERELDLLKYQIDEIERAGIDGLDEEELQSEKIRLANAEKLYEIAASALTTLEENEPSVSGLMDTSSKDIRALVKLDEEMQPLIEEFDNAQLALQEVAQTLRDYRDNLIFDEEQLREIEEKLDVIALLKRKYGGSLSEVLQFYEGIKEKYDELAHTDFYQNEIREALGKITPKLEIEAKKLREKRAKAGEALKKTIEKELKDLNIPKARFEARLEKTDFSQDGFDRLEFLVGLNVGEPHLPLKDVVSGGEASRVMLAMKKALTKVDPVLTLIFDEIDTNIGGRLGSVTGKKLKEIAKERQVLLVTHLPQIASFADKHFKVLKKAQSGKTNIEYRVIEGEERVSELSQMMAGKKETDISKKHAKELLKSQDN